MSTIRNLIILWALLIALYLVVVNFVGATALLGSIDKTAVDTTKTLQGR